MCVCTWGGEQGLQECPLTGRSQDTSVYRDSISEGDRLLYLSNLGRVEGSPAPLALPCWEPQLVPGMWLAVLGADKLLDAFLTAAMAHIA